MDSIICMKCGTKHCFDFNYFEENKCSVCESDELVEECVLSRYFDLHWESLFFNVGDKVAIKDGYAGSELSSKIEKKVWAKDHWEYYGKEFGPALHEELRRI